ncbi:response regulator transcription factor [Sphaerotilus sp.]|uniref:response regulator transcription factor n=1 Tax=Sphaerotilus sp. TaxID=2093942 RepID=UPI002ACE52A0|nr:response regulator transcription factor [Sphaerotilus sp.]MDZ7856374.1 response regulator transcription factor [Sphaerotilus sp.]
MKALLVDDHALFRSGLMMLLALRFPDVVMREADGLTAALAHLAAEPDIELVLLDLGLRDSEGLPTLRQLRAVSDELTLVVLSASDDPDTMIAALNEGAAGFIPKTTRSGTVEQALRIVLGGGIYLPPAVYSAVAPLPAVAQSDEDRSAEVIDRLGLSPRQVDVLRLLTAGQSNKVICRELDLAESTIKTHLLGLFRKLGVGSRTEAVVAAARIGLKFPNG